MIILPESTRSIIQHRLKLTELQTYTMQRPGHDELKWSAQRYFKQNIHREYSYYLQYNSYYLQYNSSNYS